MKLLLLIIYLTIVKCEVPDILEIDWSDPNLFQKFSDPKDPVPDGSAVWDKSELEDIAPVFIPRPKLISDEELFDLQQNINYTLSDKEGRVGGLPVASVWSEIVLVVYNNVPAGPGAAITFNWVLCSTRIAPDGVAASSLLVYTNIMSSADSGQLTADKRYRVKEIVVHPLKFSYYSTMMLLRVCPSTLPKFVALPPSSKNYLLGYTADFFNFVPTMNYHRKGFADSCECENQNGWDPVRTLCLKESGIVYNGPNEKGSLLFVDGVFAGINLWNTNNGGEPYTYIAKYRAWLEDTTY